MIDLGMLDRAPESARGDRPGQSHYHRHDHYRRHRRSLAVALLALALALPGGAAPPSGFTTPPRYARFDAGSARDMLAVRNVLLLSGVTSPDSALYRIDRRPTKLAGGQLGLVTVSGDIAVVVQQCVDGRSVAAGIDTRTGARRWQRTGERITAFEGYLVQRRGTTAPCPAVAASPVAIGPGGEVADPSSQPSSRPVPRAADVVDIATGRTLWTLADAGGVAPVAATEASGRSALVGIDASGRWIQRDLRSGAVLPADGAAVPSPPLPPVDPYHRPPADAPPFRQRVVSALPGIITVNTFELGRGALQAFDPQTLSPLWTIEPDPPLYLPVPIPCSDLICLDDGIETTAVRTRTGVAAWRAPWHIVALVGPRWAVVSRAGYEPGVMSGVRVVDLSAAGRTVADLPEWRPALAGSPLPFGADRGPAVLYRNGQGRTWIATVDPGAARPAIAIRMAIPGLYTACTSGDAGLVACRTGQVAAVWRLPP